MVNPFSRNPILKTTQRATHTYIIGQPGTGKSRLMESWVMQDIHAGHGVCVIDPHGDLFQNILSRVAQTPNLWSRVLIIDPCDEEYAVNLNPLKPPAGISSVRTAWFLADIILKIWKLKSTEAPRMTWLMANTFSALSDLRLPITATSRFLMDAEYRSRLVYKINHEPTRSYFELEYPHTKGGTHQWAAPLLNKLGSFLHDPDISAMFTESKGINFRAQMDKRRIILVHIPKGILGENTSNLLGAFIVAQIQQAALSRTTSKERNPYYLYLDEFQNYTADNISDILSESRKYALSMVLAHQYLDQLDRKIQSAVLNTAGTIACFRVGYDDSLRLAKNVFPTKDFNARVNVKIDFRRQASILIPHITEKKEKGGWDQLAYLISNQNNREFWVRTRTSKKVLHLRSQHVPTIHRTKKLEEGIRNMVGMSGRRYAKLKKSFGGMKYGYRYPRDNQSNSGSLWSR